MSTRLRVSRTGLDLIKGFEGFREHAARLPDGRWIVGFGHVKTAREGLSITEADAEDLLRADLRPVEEAILSLVFAPLRQNQFDALVSLAFNISPGQFKESEVLRALNAGDEIGAATGFDAWRRARINGKLIVVDALVRRRAAEKALFLEHPGGRPAAPSQLLTPELEPAPALAAPVAARAPSAPAAPGQGGGADVATAIEALAAGKSAPPPKPAAPSSPPGLQTAATPTEAARQVTERIARILEKGEDTLRPPEPAPSVPVAPSAVANEPPPRPATSQSRATPKPQADRKLIDDTEVIDPGKDAATLFEEGLRAERTVQTKRPGVILNGGIWRIAPWIGFLAMSIVGLAVTLSFALRDRAPGTEAAGPLAGTAVFALLAVLSIYFIATRGPERRD